MTGKQGDLRPWRDERRQTAACGAPDPVALAACQRALDRAAEGHAERRVLLVDPDAALGPSIGALLGAGVTVVRANTAYDALAALVPEQFGVLVLDSVLEGADLLLDRAALSCPHTPVLLYCSQAPSPACAARARRILLKQGASAEALRGALSDLLAEARLEVGR